MFYIQVLDAKTHSPIKDAVVVIDTRHSQKTNEEGIVKFDLPADDYSIHVIDTVTKKENSVVMTADEGGLIKVRINNPESRSDGDPESRSGKE